MNKFYNINLVKKFMEVPIVKSNLSYLKYLGILLKFDDNQ